MSRIHTPGAIIFVTVSVLGRRCGLLPTEAFNARAGALLAVLQDRYGLGILEFVFMSNHIHLQLRIAHVTQLACFMRDLNSGLARVAKTVHEGPVGIFWSGRYHSVELGTDWEAADKAQYIRAHGVKEGLVADPLEWPGLSSLKQRADPARCTPSGWRLCRGCRRKEVPTRDCGKCGFVKVILSERGDEVGLSGPARVAKARSDASAIKEEYALANAGGVLGVARILAQSPWEPPSAGELPHSGKASCRFVAFDLDKSVAKATYEALCEHYKATEAERKVAVASLLDGGIKAARFPAGAVVPWILPQRQRLKQACLAVDALAVPILRGGENPNYSAEGAATLVQRCRSLRERSPPAIL